MKRAVTLILIVIGVCGVLWVAKAWTQRNAGNTLTRFNEDCNSLILGLQQYKEFVGSYPTGNNIAIAKALLGQAEKKVLIVAVRRTDMNDKGEILDPWKTPYQFYFSHNEVMIRSAGPNKVWEDASVAGADDLYRCASKSASN